MRLQPGLLLFLRVFFYVESHPILSQPVVLLEAGIYRGESYKIPENGKSGQKFLGIRYAAPAERFKVPQPVENFNGVKDAINWPPACVQQFNCELEYYRCCLRNQNSLFNISGRPDREQEILYSVVQCCRKRICRKRGLSVP
jgi:hypothetical protein